MAMSQCKECGKKVSTLAKTCPSCGAPNPTKTSAKTFDKNSFVKLLDGELDLATAFWGYGVLGTGIVGFIFGWLSAVYSKWLIVPYIIFTAVVISRVFETAMIHIEEKEKKKESRIWGFLVIGILILSVFGLFDLIGDTLF
jgi:hypothetical protein